jgi:hypothetical protein
MRQLLVTTIAVAVAAGVGAGIGVSVGMAGAARAQEAPLHVCFAYRDWETTTPLGDTLEDVRGNLPARYETGLDEAVPEVLLGPQMMVDARSECDVWVHPLYDFKDRLPR